MQFDVNALFGLGATVVYHLLVDGRRGYWGYSPGYGYPTPSQPWTKNWTVCDAEELVDGQWYWVVRHDCASYDAVNGCSTGGDVEPTHAVMIDKEPYGLFRGRPGVLYPLDDSLDTLSLKDRRLTKLDDLGARRDGGEEYCVRRAVEVLPFAQDAAIAAAVGALLGFVSFKMLANQLNGVRAAGQPAYRLPKVERNPDLAALVAGGNYLLRPKAADGMAVRHCIALTGYQLVDPGNPASPQPTTAAGLEALGYAGVYEGRQVVQVGDGNRKHRRGSRGRGNRGTKRPRGTSD